MPSYVTFCYCKPCGPKSGRILILPRSGFRLVVFCFFILGGFLAGQIIWSIPKTYFVFGKHKQSLCLWNTNKVCFCETQTKFVFVFVKYKQSLCLWNTNKVCVCESRNNRYQNSADTNLVRDSISGGGSIKMHLPCFLYRHLPLSSAMDHPCLSIVSLLLICRHSLLHLPPHISWLLFCCCCRPLHSRSSAPTLVTCPLPCRRCISVAPLLSLVHWHAVIACPLTCCQCLTAASCQLSLSSAPSIIITAAAH